MPAQILANIYNPRKGIGLKNERTNERTLTQKHQLVGQYADQNHNGEKVQKPWMDGMEIKPTMIKDVQTGITMIEMPTDLDLCDGL